MNQQHIHCSVSNCHYWKDGNLCDANEIVVVSDEFGANYPDSVDAGMSKSFAPTPVSSCMATCCKTFVPEGSAKIGADGVKRL